MWTRSIWDNGHGVFIPFIVAWLVYEQLKDEAPAGPESSIWGFVFLIPGLGMLVLDTAIHTRLMAAAGLVVCLPGLSLLLLGARRTRALCVSSAPGHANATCSGGGDRRTPPGTP